MWELPQKIRFENPYLELIPLEASQHRAGLFEAARPESNQNTDIFRFMVSFGPISDFQAMSDYLKKQESRTDRSFWCVFHKADQKIIGSFALVGPSALHGTVEIGAVWYNLAYQGTYVHSMTMHLVLCYLFDELKYRRVSWQCHSQNIKSKRSAEALGFRYEGTFRNHYWSKGESRDTDWYAMTNGDWEQAKGPLVQRIERLASLADIS